MIVLGVRLLGPCYVRSSGMTVTFVLSTAKWVD